MRLLRFARNDRSRVSFVIASEAKLVGEPTGENSYEIRHGLDLMIRNLIDQGVVLIICNNAACLRILQYVFKPATGK